MNEMKMIGNYVYLNTGIMESIYHSQVQPVMAHFKRHAERMLHISMESVANFSAEHVARRKEIETRFDTEYIMRSRNWTEWHAYADMKKMEEIIFRLMSPDVPVLIHARGHCNSYKAVLLKRKHPDCIRVHVDIRGVLWDEVTRNGFINRLAAPYRRKLYQRWEEAAVKEADSVSCISDIYRQFMAERYGRNDIAVIPTFVDTGKFRFSADDRKLYRLKLDVGNRLIILYCGNAAYWQKIDETISLFEVLRGIYREPIMLFLTVAPDEIKRKVEGRLSDADVRILKVEHHEVPAYMSAADIAVMLRDDIPTNRFSAPTKFGEYLCNGLPVILSPKIGDTEQIAIKGKCGLILKQMPDRDMAPQFNSLLGLNRCSISEYGAGIFNQNGYLELLEKLYRRDMKL